MKHEMKYRQSYSMLVVNLERGEHIVNEAGAVTQMYPNIEVHTHKGEQSLLSKLICS